MEFETRNNIEREGVREGFIAAPRAETSRHGNGIVVSGVDGVMD